MPNRPIAQIVRNQVVVSASPETSVHQAALLMQEKNVSALLVMSGGKLAGIFTERDALRRVLASGRDANSTTLAAVMTAEPTTISSDKPLGHALHLMYDYGFRHMPVVDDQGNPVGVISARDALGLDMVQFERELRQREELAELIG